MQIDLNPPIWSLADAVFETLKIQHWFDAIVLIDDTVSSDLFSYRLSHLCRTGKDFKKISKVVSNKFIKSNDNVLEVWKNLMIIQLSRGLIQREVSLSIYNLYFKYL
jgi:hypothetical protein